MSVKELKSPHELNDFIRRGTTLVDFWAPWCGPCKMIAPILEEVSHQWGDELSFGKIDIEAHPSVGNEHSIQSIPCLIVFSQGKEKTRIIGFHRKEELKKAIEAAV